jgi:hypothetical protein
MSDSIQPADIFEMLNKQAADSDRRMLLEIQAQWQQYGEIKDKEVLLGLAFSSQEFFNKCLAAHPARALQENVSNVERAFDILSQSRAALIDLAGIFHSRIEYGLLARGEEKQVLSKATKEIYTYSCAASSLVQAYRHLISGRADIKAKYESVKNEVISNAGPIAFFTDLRRANNHLHILVATPHYSITNDFSSGKREVLSGIAFNRDRIIESKDWKPESKTFVSHRKNLDVLSLVEEHYAITAKFKRVVLTRTGIHSDKQIRDLRRINIARETMSYRNTLAIILQIAIPKGLNPYEYLERWFTKSELDRAYGLQDHTREQVDYLISLRDPLGLCPRDTREGLYKLFGAQLPAES